MRHHSSLENYLVQTGSLDEGRLVHRSGTRNVLTKLSSGVICLEHNSYTTAAVTLTSQSLPRQTHSSIASASDARLVGQLNNSCQARQW